MEAVIFIGLPGSGKSTFYKERFFRTHVRISLDLLRTRRRQQRFLDTCWATNQRLVIDNTSPTRSDRAEYIEAAKANRFTVVGYYFDSTVDDCLRRNSQRPANERIPDVAILTKARVLEPPEMAEGFDQLFQVRLSDNTFMVANWAE